MKIKFKKKRSTLGMSLLILLGFLLIATGFASATLAGTLFLVWISVVIAVLYDYEISDKNRLKDYAISIDIFSIQKIANQDDRVIVYYSQQGDEKIRSRRFTPRSADAFIKKLKEINPKIQII